MDGARGGSGELELLCKVKKTFLNKKSKLKRQQFLARAIRQKREEKHKKEVERPKYSYMQMRGSYVWQKLIASPEHFQKNRKNTKLTYKNWAIVAERNNSKIGVLFSGVTEQGQDHVGGQECQWPIIANNSEQWLCRWPLKNAKVCRQGIASIVRSN